MIRRGVSGNKYVYFKKAVFGESFTQPLILRERESERGRKSKQPCDVVFYICGQSRVYQAIKDARCV